MAEEKRKRKSKQGSAFLYIAAIYGEACVR